MTQWSYTKIFGIRNRLGCGLGWAKGSMCYMGAHWRHLANTNELFVCDGETALSQFTLITGYLLIFLAVV